jgi:methylase of polypeptide subunit release factors
MSMGKTVTQRLDQTHTLFEQALHQADFETGETLNSDKVAGDLGPYCLLTVSGAGAPLAILGLTQPQFSPQAVAFVNLLARRARARKAGYLVLSNQRETILQATPVREGEAGQALRRYPLAPVFSGATESLSPPEQTALAGVAEKLVADLLALQRDGRLDLIEPDADYFVDRLTRAVAVLKPAVKSALVTQFGIDPQFAGEVAAWATRQGIPADVRSPDFAEAVVRQAIYRLLGKIIFYQSLRRAIPSLPEMDVAGLDTSQVLPRLATCFAEAHKIDYHAVFREDVVDRLPFPAQASAELRDLVGVLNTRDFAHLPQDVVGAVFERLIPPEDRHALGQFFTPENLVDLIVAFCVRRPEDAVLDPTCGTGTFLIRSYDRLRTALGVHDHSQLLEQLWGVDIAPFPAELATINLFRQQVDQAGNFPRILNEDFFEVVPGGRYRFPPLKAEAPLPADEDGEGLETIPSFDAIVGNFPYISADRIEQREQGYAARMARRLAEEWFLAYPDGFTFASKTDAQQHHKARQQGLDVSAFAPKAQPNISSYADLYAWLFWHAAAFIKPGGRMGIVTSNAWLDVGFGYALQRFFLDNFKIIAILESRCEPWFEQAAVNTVVTILERCASAEDRDAHPARFVKVQRPLAEWMPWDLRLEGLRRWIGINGLVQRITASAQASDDPNQPHTRQEADFRLRAVRQGALRADVTDRSQTVKWGRYLRAPQVYFDLLDQAGDKLELLRDVAPPARGGTTRINEFFYLTQGTIHKWGIDQEYCLPLIKSPGDTSTIQVDLNSLDLKVFVCRKSKDELRAKKQLGTLAYIEWGEHQNYQTGVQRGMKWPDGPWIKDRKPGWYALPESETHKSHLFFASAYGDRHLHKFSKRLLIADKRLYFLAPADGIDDELMATVVNSSLIALFTEIAGRVSMGDGALELTVEDARDYLHVPDPRRFDEAQRQAILAAFQPLLQRPIDSVFDEMQRPDRQALDRAVLSAMGLDPGRWLAPLYEGLALLVSERTGLGKKRSQSRTSRAKKAAGRVSEDVLGELLPDGPQPFPEAFLTSAARKNLREFPLPEAPLRHSGSFFGKEELSSPDGHKITLSNLFEVRYVLYVQANGQRVAQMPTQMVEVTRTVNEYARYLRDLRQRLYESYFRRTLDQAAANRFVEELWRRLHLPELNE